MGLPSEGAPPADNVAFQRALVSHIAQLSLLERQLFAGGTADDALTLAMLCDQEHELKSKSRRFAKAITGAVDGMKRYFQVVETVVSARPEVAALVWGGLKFIIEVASKYSEYFDTISSILELIKEDLTYYHDYATLLYRNWDNVQKALSDVYGDILQLCTTVHRIFKHKDGNDRSRPGMFIRALNPWSKPFDTLEKSFKKHRTIVERQATHADKHMWKLETDAAETERSEQRWDRQSAAAERRASSLERVLARHERALQSTEREEAGHEREELKRDRAAFLVNERNKKFLSMLRAADCSLKHERLLGRRCEGTARWIFTRDKFVEWRSPGGPIGKLLWCYGNAGSGKSFLAASIIDQLRQDLSSAEGFVLVYFYFDFRESTYKDPRVFLRSILHQLLSHPLAIGVLTRIACRNIHLDSYNSPDLNMLIDEALATFQRVFVVVDALDECENLEELLPLLSGLGGKLRLLVLSRERQTIRRALRGAPIIPIQARDVKEDIDQYIKAEVYLRQCDGQLHVGNERLPTEIIRAITSEANGMFLWATLQLDHVCDQRSDHDIRSALHELPQGLNETYERSLQRIKALGARRAHRCRLALRWIIAAKSPLGPSELAQAVGLSQMDEGFWQPDRIVNNPQAIVDDCAGLCSVDGFGVQLIHESVREFLCTSETFQVADALSARMFLLPDAHLAAAELCCRYLDLVCARRMEHAHSAPLYWPYDTIMGPVSVVWHAKAASDSGNLVIADFDRLLRICEHLQRFKSDIYLSQLPDPFSFALEIQDGGKSLVQALIHQGLDANASDVDGNTPLHKAARTGSFDICSVLLSKNADTQARNNTGLTPMHMAAKAPDIIGLLLKHGGDMTAIALDGRTPLHTVVLRGDADMCDALLFLGADPKCRDQNGATPLHLYATSRQAENGDVAMSLVHHGATVSVLDDSGQTPLHYAAAAANFAQTQTLLHLGANPNLQDGRGRTALHVACHVDVKAVDRSLHDEAQVVLALAEHGASVLATDVDGATPLHLLSSQIQHTAASDDAITIALFATLARSTPDCLSIRDHHGRALRSIVGRSSMPRLDNLFWRLTSPNATPVLSSPSLFYCRWLKGGTLGVSEGESGEGGNVPKRRPRRAMTTRLNASSPVWIQRPVKSST